MCIKRIFLKKTIYFTIQTPIIRLVFNDHQNRHEQEPSFSGKSKSTSGDLPGPQSTSTEQDGDMRESFVFLSHRCERSQRRRNPSSVQEIDGKINLLLMWCFKSLVVQNPRAAGLNHRSSCVTAHGCTSTILMIFKKTKESFEF